MIYCHFQMLIIDYCLDMFRTSLCPSSGEKTTCYSIWGFLLVVLDVAVLVGPCHHGMARPQVADRGTASNKEGSCE